MPTAHANQSLANPPHKVNIELHISERLKAILPPLTAEEFAGLEANIVRAGKVLDAVRYWHDGERAVVVDGMHRLEIAVRLGLPYPVEGMEFPNYEAVEAWMDDFALDRRNLTDEWRKRLLGRRLSRAKQARGGDRKSEEAKSKCQNETLIGKGGDSQSGDTASALASATGVSRNTVIRAEKLNKALDSFPEAMRASIEKESDTLILAVAKMSKEQQSTLWGDVRSSRQPGWKEDAKAHGYIRPKAKPKSDTTDAGVQATPAAKPSGGNGKPSKWDDIPIDLHARLKELDTTSAEITRLSELNMDDQRTVVKLVDGTRHHTVASALGAWNGPVVDTGPPPESPAVTAAKLVLKKHRVQCSDEQATAFSEHEPEVQEVLAKSIKDGKQTLDQAIERGDVPDLTTEEQCECENKAIEKYCREVLKFANDTKPDVSWIDDMGRFECFLQKLKDGLTTVRSAKSVICPACKGEGCKTCKAMGFLPKLKADQIGAAK
jgi:hypothetical protein